MGSRIWKNQPLILPSKLSGIPSEKPTLCPMRIQPVLSSLAWPLPAVALFKSMAGEKVPEQPFNAPTYQNFTARSRLKCPREVDC